MQVTQITYATTVNLGNFENERIEFTADLESGEDATAALRNLKKLVLDQAGGDQTNSAPAPAFEGLFLRDSAGQVRTKHDTSSAWLKDFEEKARLTADLFAFYNANEAVLSRIKQDAGDNPNPRVLERVDDVILRVTELMNG